LIYDSAAGGSDWNVALTHMARFLSARDIAIASHDMESRQEDVISLPIDPEFVRSYAEHWSRRNFLWDATSKLPLGQVFNFDAAMPREQFFRSALYNSWFRPQQLDHALGANFLRDGSLSMVATIYRPSSQPDFGDREIARFKALLPHFQRALQMRWDLKCVQHLSGDIRAVLEAIGRPALLVAGDARLILSNTEGDEAIRKKILRKNESRILAARLEVETANLRMLVFTAASLNKSAAGGKMVVSRDEPHNSALLTISPLPGMRFGGSDQLALILVDDPGRDGAVPPDPVILKQQFGLTQAEARLAIALLGGETLRGAADKSGVTFETARTHLARIFEKTGVHGQPSLMRLLRRAGHDG
jgi:DNA-binding CsgD family transcriptional regulator